MMKISAYERVKKSVNGEKPDQIPLCFWHHFRTVKSGEELAEKTYDFFVKKFQLDIVKIMPDLPYPIAGDSIDSYQQLQNFRPFSIDTPIFQEQLTCIKILRSKVGKEYPILLTLFSPVSYMFRFIGKEKAIKIAREHPDEFFYAVNTITDTLSLLMSAAIEYGADGIFFSCMGATTSDFTRQEYRKYVRPSDLKALQSAEKGWLNTIHIHSYPDQIDDKLYFDLFTDYPASVFNWSDGITGPNLKEASSMTGKCLMGGLMERGPLVNGDKGALLQEITGALKQTAGKCFILANGCSIPDDTPEKWLHLARKISEEMLL
jgi:uroporphyrinogen decarboxylase